MPTVIIRLTWSLLGSRTFEIGCERWLCIYSTRSRSAVSTGGQYRSCADVSFNRCLMLAICLSSSRTGICLVRITDLNLRPAVGAARYCRADSRLRLGGPIWFASPGGGVGAISLSPLVSVFGFGDGPPRSALCRLTGGSAAVSGCIFACSVVPCSPAGCTAAPCSIGPLKVTVCSLTARSVTAGVESAHG